MVTIEFGALYYYPSYISNECITLGILFHNLQTNERSFEITKNWDRVESFDDEININFMKSYLLGIRAETSMNLSNFQDTFDLKKYARYYVNEYKFSDIQTFTTDNEDLFIENTKKLFLKFDYEKSQRLRSNEEKRYIRDLLKSNDIDYSCKNTPGKYLDEINFDYTIDNYGIKIFTFEGKNLAYLVSTAKTWAFNALTLQGRIKTIIIYDTEISDSKHYETIMSILKAHSYKVLNMQEGFDFLLSLNKNDSLLEI